MKFAAPLNHELIPTLQWIEVASSLQIPSFHIIGLPAPEVAEARERIRGAILASGLEFPKRRIVINLSPASIRKRGTGLDLAMALAVLRSARKKPLPMETRGEDIAAWGELGLDGTVKPAGQLTRALYAAWQERLSRIVIAREELHEAELALELLRQSSVFETKPPLLLSVSTLAEAWELLDQEDPGAMTTETEKNTVPLSRCGNENVPEPPHLLPLPRSLERILGVALSGDHHVLILGPRGAGKSHALEWVTAIAPPCSADVRLNQVLLQELTELPGNAGALSGGSRVPIQRVGAHTRPAALLGSVHPHRIQPGIFTLAHGGILIADEFPEWPRDTRESLREPLETAKITLTRSHRSVLLPARFMLAANGNLCPCGGWPSNVPVPEDSDSSALALPPCRCTPPQKQQYMGRLSGPVLDRIDLVSTLGPSQPNRKPESATSESPVRVLREKTQSIRIELIQRWGAPSARIPAEKLEQLLRDTPAWKRNLDLLGFTSLRSRHKTLRVALTLAAWDGCAEPNTAHFFESASYRPERHVSLNGTPS